MPSKGRAYRSLGSSDQLDCEYHEFHRKLNTNNDIAASHSSAAHDALGGQRHQAHVEKGGPFDHPGPLTSHPVLRIFAHETPVPLQPEQTQQEATAIAKSKHDSEDHTIPSPPVNESSRRESPDLGNDMAPPIPRKSSKRKLKGHVPSSKSPPRQKNSSSRRIPRSRTAAWLPKSSARVSEAKVHVTATQPGSAKVVPSSQTAPLGEILGTHSPVSARIDDGSVSKSVQAMKNATRILKGSPSKSSLGKGPSGVRGLSHKVSSKVSHVWNRLTSPKPSIRYKISAPLEASRNDMPSPLSKLQASASHFRMSVAPREGDNQSEKQESSVSRVESREDPFVSPDPHTPTKFESQLRANAMGQDAAQVVDDPFDDSQEFNSDLTGLLNDQPVATSTPRNRAPEPASPEGSPSDGRHVLSAGPLEHQNGNSRYKPSSASATEALPRYGSPYLQRKKHPSPSQDELNELTSELIKAGIMPSKLPVIFAGASRESLVPLDKNKIIQRASPEKSAIQKTSSSRPTGLPGPIGSKRSATRTRVGTMKHPTGVEAHQEDELA